MLVRIVKLTFQEDKIVDFLNNFNEVKHLIRSFDGNEFLELYQDKHDTRIFFTYSYWKNESALENYRKSALFNVVWAYTKTLFAEKPEAWSVNKLDTLL
jgi:heme-degrading monooxygenase HmoA